jgi:Fur family ferric uptake transcriptional regulator
MAAGRRQEWSEHALATLRSAGYRKGGARAAVIDHLAGQRCAVTAHDIAEALDRGGRGVGRASVYRVLDLLAQHRLVQRLDMGDGIARYEAIAPSGDHHHHLLCAQCGRLVPFDDSELERSIERLAERLNFDVEEHDVLLHGSCERCGPATPAPARAGGATAAAAAR